MRPKQHETRGSGDLFRARLDQIINMRHELAQLAGKIDWDFIDGEIAPLVQRPWSAWNCDTVCHRAFFKVEGDHYAGEFPRESFLKQGISYEVSKQAKSDLFRDLLPLLNSGGIILPQHDRLVAQLVGSSAWFHVGAEIRSVTLRTATTLRRSRSSSCFFNSTSQ